MENFVALPKVFDIFKFQGWNDFLRILEDIYTRLVPTFYSTIVPSDEDNTSIQSIIGSFELQVLSFDIAQLTNTSNDGILCRVRERWWKELGVTEEEVAVVLTGKRSVHVRNIRTSHLLTSVKVVYSVVQHTVLPWSGNTDVMTEVD